MVELTYQETENLINEISSGKKFVEYNGSFYVLKHPSRQDIFMSRVIYKKTFNEAKKFGLPTQEDMEVKIKERGIYTDEDDEKIKSIEEKIKGQRAVLEKTFRVQARRDRLVDIINELQKEIDVIRRKKLNLMIGTCEAKASEEQNIFLCRKYSFKVNDEGEETRLWNNKEEFDKESPNLVQNILYHYIVFERGIEVPIIRALARSSLFSLRYINSVKTSAQLFDLPVCDYTVDMLNLSYWANWYRSIYEMLPDEAPPSIIIDDDDALDSFMEDYYNRKKNEREFARSNSSNNRSKFLKKNSMKSAYDHPDVIITKSNPIYQDVEFNHGKRFSKENKGKVDIKEKQ